MVQWTGYIINVHVHIKTCTLQVTIAIICNVIVSTMFSSGWANSTDLLVLQISCQQLKFDSRSDIIPFVHG